MALASGHAPHRDATAGVDPADEVTKYLGDARGYSRLSIPKREEFLLGTYQQYNTPEGRVALNRALRSMSTQELEVFANATFDVARERGGETAELLYHVGLVHESWGDIEAATGAFAEALRLKSESADARLAAMMPDE